MTPEPMSLLLLPDKRYRGTLLLTWVVKTRQKGVCVCGGVCERGLLMLSYLRPLSVVLGTRPKLSLYTPREEDQEEEEARKKWWSQELG